jgi:nucleoside-diphosphate-sugar epimerase
MNVFVTSLKGNIGVLLKDYIKKKKYRLINQKKLNNVDKIDLAIHNGASTPEKNIFKIFYSNFIKNIFLIIKLNKKNVRKFIFFSSISVYGQAKNRVLKETSKRKKATFYGHTKYWGEYIFLKYLKCPVICLRLPAVLSASNKNHFFGKLFQKLVLNEDIIINNHKRIYNSIISTDNLFNFIFSIKTNFEKDIINLGLNNKYKLINIIKNLKKRIKSSSKLIVTKNSEFHYIINIDKAKHKYFFRPYSLNKTINSWIELIKK